MRWLRHELDDDPWPDPPDEYHGWSKELLLLMLMIERRGETTGVGVTLEPIAEWLTGKIQVTPSQQPRRPNKNMDFRPVPIDESEIKIALEFWRGKPIRIGDLHVLADGSPTEVIHVDHVGGVVTVRKLDARDHRAMTRKMMGL